MVSQLLAFMNSANLFMASSFVWSACKLHLYEHINGNIWSLNGIIFLVPCLPPSSFSFCVMLAPSTPTVYASACCVTAPTEATYVCTNLSIIFITFVKSCTHFTFIILCFFVGFSIQYSFTVISTGSLDWLEHLDQTTGLEHWTRTPGPDYILDYIEHLDQTTGLL